MCSFARMQKSESMLVSSRLRQIAIKKIKHKPIHLGNEIIVKMYLYGSEVRMVHVYLSRF